MRSRNGDGVSLEEITLLLDQQYYRELIKFLYIHFLKSDGKLKATTPSKHTTQLGAVCPPYPSYKTAFERILDFAFCINKLATEICDDKIPLTSLFLSLCLWR